MTTTPQEKTAKEWLKHLPEPLRTEALEACEKWPLIPGRECSFDACISIAIDWDDAKDPKWSDISKKLISGEILPVEPEHEKQQEPKQMSDYITKEELNEAFGNFWERISKKIEASLKDFEHLKPIEDKQPEPAPVKLPVTVEEVWELERGMRGKDSWFIAGAEIDKSTFNGLQLIQEYRHESTAKFVDAVRKLTKIAEAQNEMCERGERVWYAYNKEGIIDTDNILVCSVGQIYFHSELGLKDCIRANEQLWKDYLRIS